MRRQLRRCTARRGRVALSALVVAVASAGGFWLGVLRNMANDNLGLVARESSLNFGEIGDRGEFPWTLVIENPKSQTIVIESLETTCGCTVATPKSLVIAPNASAEILLRIDLSPRGPVVASSPLTDFSVDVKPIFRQGERTQPGRGWTVRGRVRHGLPTPERVIKFDPRWRSVTARPWEERSPGAEAATPMHRRSLYT